MIWSCLQGHMGRVEYLGDGPDSAMAVLGDFCFFAGRPAPALVRRAAAPLLVPRDGDWDALIRRSLGPEAVPFTRYATRKEPDAFRRESLVRLSAALPEGVSLVPIGAELYPALMAQVWSRDLCGQFRDGGDFARRGIGVAALWRGEPVAGAASYSIYDGGIEVEIDTRPDLQGRGLATACGAQLILDCLDRGLYPSWDAHNRRSLALAERLGYRLSHPYRAYWVESRVREAR